MTKRAITGGHASPEDGLRPATQARLLLRWIMVGILVALISLLYYFLVGPDPFLTR